jgi:hypothetical protein
MTAKAFSGLLRLCDTTFWFRHPLQGWAIVSRRFMRWFTGLFMLAALISNILLIHTSLYYDISLLIQGFFYVLFLVGALTSTFNRSFRVADWAFIFVVANVGMSLGIIKAFWGMTPSAYSKVK